jgi:hypothetical protein
MLSKKDFKYCEIVKENHYNRGDIVLLPEDKTNLDLDYFGKEVVNGFHSVFMHNNELLEYKNINNTIRGYIGNVYCEYLYWDMDNESIERAKEDSIELIERLKIYSDNIRIYFSGNKGFHIIVYYPELEKYIERKNFNELIKNICEGIAKDLVSFDNKIYDKTRIIRTPNSKHGITNLYKIELTYKELKTLNQEQIFNLAKQQRKLEFNYKKDNNSDLNILIEEASKEKPLIKDRGLFAASELLDGIINGFQTGSRNNAFASIAGMLHSRNIDNNFIKAILYKINTSNEVPLSERELDNIIYSISKYQVDEKYILPTNKDILNFRDAGSMWLKNIELSGDFSLGDRFQDINETMSVTLLGDLIGIVSNSGVGKSTLTMDFINSYAQIKDKYSLFISLEMASHACFFRGATISYTPDENGEVSSKEIAYNLIHKEDIREAIYKEWNKLLIVDKGSIALDQIENYATIANDVCGNRLGCIGIDYAQYIDGASEIDKSLYIAREVKSVIKRLSVIGFIAMQCNKIIPNSYVEVEDLHIEGVKAWKQACDYIMGFWKSKADNKRLHGKFLKTRWGKDDKRFDIKRNGLKYNCVEILPENYNFGL